MDELLNSLKSDLMAAQQSAMARVPLYHQVYSVLKSAILNGSIPHASKMPTEHQITDTFDVSRITAKRAMDELAAEKLVTRTRGKGSCNGLVCSRRRLLCSCEWQDLHCGSGRKWSTGCCRGSTGRKFRSTGSAVCCGRACQCGFGWQHIQY